MNWLLRELVPYTFWTVQTVNESYVHSKHPDLKELPKHIYHARYEVDKSALQHDAKLIEPEAAVDGRDQEQIVESPEAFANVESLVEKRRA